MYNNYHYYLQYSLMKSVDILYMQQATWGLVLQWFYTKLSTKSPCNNGSIIVKHVLDWIKCDVVTLYL